jgi:cobalt-zinc-cadmium efflux system membrane fusion protein
MNLSLNHLPHHLRQPRVLLPLAISTSLLVGIGVGRQSSRPVSAPPVAAIDRVDEKLTVALSEDQLRRLGLTTVRPELSTGTERPITGFVEAATSSRSSVGMPIAGRVLRLMVSPGTTVRAGEPIAEVQSADAAVVRADADAARATAQSLAYQYRLAEPMARQGALSAQELESRRIASVTAATTARAAAAKAAALGQPNVSGRLLIRSPIAGRVSAVSASPGAVLSVGEDVAQISDATGSELRFLVSPGLATNLRTGQLLRVRAGAQTLQARVIAVAPDAQTGSRVMLLRAQLVDGRLPPIGTAITAFVQVPSTDQRFIVPEDSLALINGSPVVFRYQRGAVEQVFVVVAQQTAGQAEILQGVRQGDVLLRGNTQVLRNALAASSGKSQN